MIPSANRRGVLEPLLTQLVSAREGYVVVKLVHVNFDFGQTYVFRSRVEREI